MIIKLVRANTYKLEYINANHVVRFCSHFLFDQQGQSTSGSGISLTDGSTIEVYETPEDVCAKIQDARRHL